MWLPGLFTRVSRCDGDRQRGEGAKLALGNTILQEAQYAKQLYYNGQSLSGEDIDEMKRRAGRDNALESQQRTRTRNTLYHE